MVRVLEVDAHFAQASAAGAMIVIPSADYPYGGRPYTADGVAGHRWTFSQTIANVDPATWGVGCSQIPQAAIILRNQEKSVPSQSFLDKLMLAPPASFHVLDPAKAKRMNAKTLYIPGPAEVARAINAIPRGQTRTIVDLRQALAKEGNAETSCPAATLKYWKWMAQVSEAPGGKTSPYAIPWWRVLKDGKPSRHMPGGVERQIALLKREGVKI